MRPGQIEVFTRLAILIACCYAVYGVRLAIAYKRWLWRKSSWGKFWPYRNHCEANFFDWMMEFLAGLMAFSAIIYWIISPAVNEVM